MIVFCLILPAYLFLGLEVLRNCDSSDEIFYSDCDNVCDVGVLELALLILFWPLMLKLFDTTHCSVATKEF
jgi:hypothetical protein